MMVRRRPIRVLILGLVISVLGAAKGLEADSGARLPADLSNKAAEQGSVRVIVQLRVEAVPEGQLGSADTVESQRQAIVAVRSDLLADLTGTDYRVLRTYETIAFIALEVSADALRALQRSPLVVGVEEDRPEFPQTGFDRPAGEKARPRADAKSCSHR